MWRNKLVSVGCVVVASVSPAVLATASTVLCDDSYRALPAPSKCPAICTLIDQDCGGIYGCFDSAHCGIACLQAEQEECGIHPDAALRQEPLCSPATRQRSKHCDTKCATVDHECKGPELCYGVSLNCGMNCRDAELSWCGTPGSSVSDSSVSDSSVSDSNLRHKNEPP